MKNLILLLLLPPIFACGSNNFAKRKFTKGVYVEKRLHPKYQRTNKNRKTFQEGNIEIDEKALGKKNPELIENVENQEKKISSYNAIENKKLSNLNDEIDINQLKEIEALEERNLISPEGDLSNSKNQNKDPIMLPFWLSIGLTGVSIGLFAILSAIFSSIPWLGILIGLSIASATFLTGSVFTIISGSKVHSKSIESNGKSGKHKFFSFLFWFGFTLLIISLAMFIYTLADGFPLFSLMIALPVALVGIGLLILGFFLLKKLGKSVIE